MEFKPLQWFFVLNSCEKDYSKSPYIQEYFSAISSFAFFVPYIIRILLLRRVSLPNGLIKMYYALILVGITSTIFHSRLSYLTQFIDMTSILVTQLIFAKIIDMKIPKTFEKLMMIFYVLSFVHPLPLSLNLVILFILFSRWTFSTVSRINMMKFTLIAGVSLILKLCALFCIPLDLICTGYEYFHGFWHIFIAAYCFTGLIGIELLLKSGHLKPKVVESKLL
ncbi:unnamed protein product [Blepharisma stoltei]|uniref:Alkaline ceramidase n=1 Tax=Blepharisma stoltei TaxID=1481888 RepID=A0AAU9KI55_9CILI|nr:unnamed protein product [Blepharisma stoltei]